MVELLARTWADQNAEEENGSHIIFMMWVFYFGHKRLMDCHKQKNCVSGSTDFQAKHLILKGLSIFSAPLFHMKQWRLNSWSFLTARMNRILPFMMAVGGLAAPYRALGDQGEPGFLESCFSTTYEIFQEKIGSYLQFDVRFHDYMGTQQEVQA